MKRELRELLQELAAQKAQVQALLGEDKVKEAESKMDGVRKLQAHIALQQELMAADEPLPDAGTLLPVEAPPDLNAEYKRVFMRGLRNQRLTASDRSIVADYRRQMRAAVMHEGGADEQADGDMDIIIPQDIQTRIMELMRTLNDLSVYIRIETVNTLSGSRVLELDEDMTPMAVVEEYGPIQLMDNPKFTPVTYKLVKRAGYLPLTSELLADVDQNILAYVTNWIAKKHVVTRNGLITALLDGLDKQPLADLSAIKKIINVELDPALVSAGGMILTNQDGYHWMDEQVDGFGRFMLQDDITQPGRKLFKGLPVEVIANRFLPSDNNARLLAPVVIGNFKQLMVLFTRGLYELSSTREGGDAWRRDTTELRTITRDDCVLWDEDAVVYGQLDVSGD